MAESKSAAFSACRIGPGVDIKLKLQHNSENRPPKTTVFHVAYTAKPY